MDFAPRVYDIVSSVIPLLPKVALLSKLSLVTFDFKDFGLKPELLLFPPSKFLWYKLSSL